MNFIWQATQLRDDEHIEIESNIINELKTVGGLDETSIAKWMIHISENRGRHALAGVLLDLEGALSEQNSLRR